MSIEFLIHVLCYLAQEKLQIVNRLDLNELFEFIIQVV